MASAVDESYLKNTIRNILWLLDQYSYLVDTFVLDFFVDDNWSKLPPKWQKVLNEVDSLQMSHFLSGNNLFCGKEVWPLSLLAFRSTCFSLAKTRNHHEAIRHVTEFLDTRSSKGRVESLNWVNAVEELTQEGGQHRNLHHLLRRHVKPKKQHEIARFADLIKLTLPTRCTHVVDVGSGRGHLSRLLSLTTDYQVISIEAESSHVSGAQRFDSQASQTMNKMKAHSDVANDTLNNDKVPKHILQMLTSEISSDDFNMLLRSSLSYECVPDFAIVGLHTCGNLGSTMLKLFCDNSHAVALFSIGCCYMKLTVDSKNFGYPLSHFVSGLGDINNLSYCAREMACHAIEKHCQKLQGNATALKIHCYRAALEVVILKFHPSRRRLGLRSVKKAETMEFEEYARLALQRTDVEIPDDALTSAESSQNLRKWNRVLTFYSLRLLLAPLVETVILYDKLLFLIERGIQCTLIPLFDPLMSPRNHVLIAIKK